MRLTWTTFMKLARSVKPCLPRTRWVSTMPAQLTEPCPGDKSAIHHIVVVVEDPLMLLINGNEGLVVEFVARQRLE